jgi:hypothetical protein
MALGWKPPPSSSLAVGGFIKHELIAALRVLDRRLGSVSVRGILEHRETNKFLKGGCNFWKHPHPTLPEVRYAMVGVPKNAAQYILDYIKKRFPESDVQSTPMPSAEKAVETWMGLNHDRPRGEPVDVAASMCIDDAADGDGVLFYKTREDLRRAVELSEQYLESVGESRKWSNIRAWAKKKRLRVPAVSVASSLPPPAQVATMEF